MSAIEPNYVGSTVQSNKAKLNILNGLGEDLKNLTGKNIFPKEIFPEEIQELINELEITLNFAPDYSAASILYTISVAIGNKIQLKVKNSWLEKSSIYMILIGRTGDVKSHSLTFCLNPLMKIDKQNFEEYLIKKKEFEALPTEEKSKITAPILRQILLNDFTPEAFVKTHYYNSRGVGLYTDEIAGFFNSFNQYRKGNEEESYLSAWSGKPIVKNRISGDEIRIDNTKVDIIGTMQEGILSTTFHSNKMKNGFIDRFLFAIPHKYVVNRWNDNDLATKYIDYYSDFIQKVFHLAEQSDYTLELSCEAKNHLYHWQNGQPVNFEFEYQRGISVKLQQYVLRFSLLLEVINSIVKDEIPKDISLQSVRSAINLRDYFFENAVRVFEIIGGNYFDTLTEIQKNIFDKLPQQFKTGEGVMIAKDNSMSERSFKNFLNDEKLFKKIAHGIYDKHIF